MRRFRDELREAFTGGGVGRAIGGFRTGLGEEKEIREEVNRRLKLTEQERRKRLEEVDKATAEAKHERIRISSEDEEGEIKLIKDVILARKQQTAAAIRDDRLEGQIIINRINRITKELEAEAALDEQRISDRLDISEKKKQELIAQTGRISRRTIAERVRDLKKDRDAIFDNIAAEEDSRDRFVDAERAKIVLIRTRIRDEENVRRRILKASILRPSAIATEQDVRQEFGLRDTDTDIDRVDNKLRRLGVSAGRAFGQFRLGVGLAREGLSDAEKQLLRTSSGAQRLGAHLGNAVRPAGAFRVRILALIGVLQILGTLVVQFGAALVALASSAILAAAALGGALLAGLTQLIPVVGLLAAAFSRLGAVLDAANLADKLEKTNAEDQKNRLDGIRQATQRLADSRFALMKAGEAVKDSEFDLAQAQQDVKDALKNQTDAIKELAEARKQAARDIVDANLEEKEAALALEEAELGVLEAKQRLREEEERSQLNVANIGDAKAQLREAQDRLVQARSEGDEAEISVALQQLSVAEQDLQQIKSQAEETQNDVKQAQIDVKQANVNQQQAVIRNKRAQEDAAKARKQGIEGSDRVVRAQENLAQATKSIAQAERQQVLATRALRDSIHALAVAKREETDAETGLTDARKKATAQQEQLQDALGDLSPAERKLFKSIQKIKEIYKTNFRPITDIIVNAFTTAVDRIAVLLQDPKILKSATTLATEIGKAVDKLSKFSISPEFRRFLVFSIGEAAKNVPKITDGFIALARVLIRVARAATPIFDNLIDRFVKFLERLDKATENPRGLEKFFATAGKHLDSWLKFAGAVGRILGLVIKFSAPAGKGILDDLTAKLNEWSDWLNEHKEEVKAFFANVRIQVGGLATALGKMAVILFKAFSSKEASELSILILDTIIPAFALFLQMLGFIATVINAIFKIPLIGPLAKNIITFSLALVIGAKVIATVIPLFLRLASVFKALITVMKSGIIVSTIAGITGELKAFIALAKQFGVIAALSAAFPKLAAGIKLVGAALRFVFITNPWIAIIVAIIAAIILLDRKFHFLAPTIRAIQKAALFVFNWIKSNWKLLLAIMLGPFGLIIIGVIKWRDKIIDFFKSVINWARDHWKLLLVAILLAPFSLAGLIILGIFKFKDKILEIIRSIPSLIVKAFEKLPSLLLAIFNKIPGLLKEALKGLGGIVKSALQKIPVIGSLFGGGKSEQEKFADLVKEPDLDEQDIKKIKRLRGQGLSVTDIIAKLFKDQGITKDLAKKLLEKYAFAHGGQVPGGEGAAVPVIAHAGEWILNKAQQAKIAQSLGLSIQQAKMLIFGTAMDEKGKKQATGMRDASGQKSFSGTTSAFGRPTDFNLIPKTDPDGIVVWFIEMSDGAFGQVSPRDARRIIASKGAFIPGYVRRSTHGFTFKDPKGSKRGGFARGGVVQNFLKGGVVMPGFAGPMLQSFAEGGTVLQQSGFGAPSETTNTKTIQQNFEVTTQGETDWNYIMRLGAQHAQGSYT